MTRTSDTIQRIRRHWAEQPDDDAVLEALRERAGRAAPVRSFVEALSADSLALIVEPKRATAERGVINPDLDVATVAAECERAGASAISIVTDAELSGGSLHDLSDARRASDLPVLARDFVVDPRQVLQLRAAGADALLVPAIAHVDQRPEDDADGSPAPGSLHAIVELSHALSMDVVLSVCTDEELAWALEQDADAINIDNRDEDGRVDVERTFELLADVPVGWPVISESIASVDQVAKLHRAGVDALLLDEGHLDTGLTNALAVYTDLTLDA